MSFTTKGIVLNRGPLFKRWTLLILLPTGKTKRTYIRFPTVLPWHPLFGVEPTPAGLEPAVLTVILRGMAPDTGFEPINAESESAGLPISLIR